MGRARSIQEIKTMTYATATQLMTRFDATEIAQRADRGVPRLVSGALLAAAAAGESLAAWTAEEQAAAAKALVVVQRALQDGDDTINSYVSTRYTLPLAPVPPVLERVACDLARYYLYDDQVTEAVKQRYDACIKLLGDVAAGRVTLGADGATGQEPATSAAPELSSGGRVWGRDNSTGFI